ncbi:hypothetical protein [Methylobacterium planeticum]|uniref:Uncharacterized protein n=1 Tax=Methylobacterium planeticum TaxID=2615211 RepID=A0A6N6MRG6_9HYPH|nr:hypothetical protein [Methylobacterium planeticum]KAB1074325.1 hypothetical protein F6X51_08080 [Methylobacterium planeticum]
MQKKFVKPPAWTARRLERHIARRGSILAVRWIAFGSGRSEGQAGSEPAGPDNVVQLRPRPTGTEGA